MRTVAAVPAAALISGAAAGLLLDTPRAFATLVLIAAAGVSAWAWRRASIRVFAAAVAAVFFIGGALLASDAWQRAWRPSLRVAFESRARQARVEAAREGRRLPEDDEAFAIVGGTLRADAAPTENGVSVSVDVDGLEREEGPRSASLSGERQPGSATGSLLAVRGGIVVTVVGTLGPELMAEWRAGRRVRMPVQLRRPSRYLDPGVPDHERALARRGTTLVGTVKSGALVEVLAHGSRLDEAMGAARAFARHAIADAVGRWSAQSAAIVAAIVIGDRAGLDADVQRRLQDAGTYHVIAISGGNIAILAGLLIAGFRVVGRLGRTAMLTSAAALLAYADFVGSGASVDRATLMAVIYFAARAVDLRSAPLNALAVTAALLVAADPLAVVDPAFLLTFGATLAILVVVPAVESAKEAKDAKDAKKSAVSKSIAASSFSAASASFALFRSVFLASVAVEALVFPIGALLFSRITFAGLGLNFLAIPLMAVAQVAGMLVVPLALVSRTLAAAAGWIAHIGAAGLVGSADVVPLASFLARRVAQPSSVVIAIYYVAVVTWWTLWRRRVETVGSAERHASRRTRHTAAVAAASAALWILIDPRAILARRADGLVHLTVIDVGQGDAILVRLPNGSTLLVDTGGLGGASTFDVGDRVVAPVLRETGIRRLDVLALTHGDPDHIGGAPSILREFHPREAWEGIPVPPFAPLTALRVAAQAQGTRWANVYAGDHVTIGGVDVTVHHPRHADWERQHVRNDDSIVLELRWRDLSIVLTGDAGRAVEREIASTFDPARLRVLKIPHHGSVTSSSIDFVRALHPHVAIVSAGRGNHFGHPVPEVLERYRDTGAEVFRTDRDGAVTVESDGYSLNVHTFGGRTVRVDGRNHEDTKQN
jgi:competence protein ComEC